MIPLHNSKQKKRDSLQYKGMCQKPCIIDKCFSGATCLRWKKTILSLNLTLLCYYVGWFGGAQNINCLTFSFSKELTHIGKICFQFFNPDVTGNNYHDYLTKVQTLLHCPFIMPVNVNRRFRERKCGRIRQTFPPASQNLYISSMRDEKGFAALFLT